jgi:hypothetical protein
MVSRAPSIFLCTFLYTLLLLYQTMVDRIITILTVRFIQVHRLQIAFHVHDIAVTSAGCKSITSNLSTRGHACPRCV